MAGSADIEACLAGGKGGGGGLLCRYIKALGVW